MLLKVGAYGPDVGFVLVRIGQGRFSGVIAQKLPQKHQKDFFLPELLVFLNDHGVQVAQRTRQFALAQDALPEPRQDGLPRDFPHGRAHDVGQHADAPVAERFSVIGAAAVRLVGGEGEQGAFGGDVFLSAASQFPRTLLDEPDQVVVVEMIREGLQHVLEPVGFDGEFRVVVYGSCFFDHGPMLLVPAFVSCMILRFGRRREPVGSSVPASF